MSQPPAVFGPPPGLPPGTPTGAIHLHLASPGRLASAMTTPRVQLDGFPAPAQWATTTYVVPAGDRHLDVWAEYLFPYGRTALGVHVAPGQAVDVFYAIPHLTFLPGAIGFAPQTRPGRLAMIIAAVVLGLLVLGIVGLVVFTIANG